MLNKEDKHDYLKYGWLLLSIIIQSFSLLLGKISSNSIQETGLFVIITNKYYILSILCLGLQAIFWQLTLRKMDLSIAYPSTSLVFLLVLIYSVFVFGEVLSINNIVGVFLMIIGAVQIIRRSGETK